MITARTLKATNKAKALAKNIVVGTKTFYKAIAVAVYSQTIRGHHCHLLNQRERYPIVA